MSIDLRHLRCFVAVAEELHFRRAAERLGIAQPALSRTIFNLEKELGVTLLERTNRIVDITTTGKTFLEGCYRVLNRMERTIENTKRVHEGKIGSLRIGYTENAISGCVPEILKSFQDLQPDIDLQLHHSVTAVQLKNLEDKELDIGFVTGAINRKNFETRLVQSETFVCVVYKGHALARRKNVRLSELADEDIIHGTSTEWEYFFSYLIPLCRKSGFEPKIVQEGLNTAAILGLVSCGMGITILTDCVRNLVGANLVVIPLEQTSERLETVAIWKTDTTDGAKERFLKFLELRGKP
ncbi:MAG: LysR family transcriptional regulator [Ascidiaceihabitans sp.]|nr:LysR family transcriptional regulator [Ascidiaceihabitans sp.]